MKKLLNKKILSKSFMGISLISFEVLFLMMAIVFGAIYEETTKNYESLTRTAMANIDTVFVYHMEEAMSEIGSLYNTPQGMVCRAKEDYSLHTSNVFVNSLVDEMLVTPYIHSIYFMNKYGEIALHIGDNNKKFTEDIDIILAQKVEELQRKKTAFAWIANNRYEGKAAIPLLTVYHQETLYNTPQYLGTVFMNLDMVEFSKSVFSTMNQGTRFYVIDAEGNVILSNRTEQCGENWMDKEYISGLQSAEESMQIIKEAGKSWDVFSVPSARKGYYVVAWREHTGLLSSLQPFFALLSAIVVGMSFFIILGSVFVSTWLYKPFNQLIVTIKKSSFIDAEDEEMGDIQFLEKSFGRLTGYISVLNKKSEEHFFVKGFLAGTWNADMQKILLDNNAVAPWKSYYTILVYCGQKRDNSALKESEYSGMIESVYSSLLEKYEQCTCLDLGMGRFLLILSEGENGSFAQEELLNVLRNARKLCSDLYDKKIYSLICGCVQDGRDCYTMPFEQLDSILKLRRLLEDDRVAINGTTIDYAAMEQIVDNIVEAAKLGNKEIFQENLVEYLELCSMANYQTFLMQTADIAGSIQKLRNNVRTSNKNIVFSHSQFRRQIRNMTSRMQLLEWFDSLYEETIVQIDKVKKYTTETGMEKAVDYIHNNFHNSDLNVDMLSDMLGISSAYCGKKFKEYTGIGAMEYIAKVRIEKAREMLITKPDKEIAQIAKEVGFSNQGYFATKFKEFYGVSPSKFRDFNVASKLNKG